MSRNLVMWFAQKHASNVVLPAIFVDDQQLKEVDKQRYLGIIFDRHLQRGPQLSSVCSSGSYYLNLLSLHWKSLSFDVRKMLTDH